MKRITLLLLFISASSHCFNFWPNGSAPCNTTLQFCVDNSSQGEYIEIRTNLTINEDIFTINSVSLVAGIGYKPFFSNGNNLQMSLSPASGANIKISGLTFEGGRIEVNNFTQSNTIEISNNTIQSVLGFNAIKVTQINNSALEILIKNNQVTVDFGSSALDNLSAIWVNKNGVTNGSISGDIVGNTVRADGLAAKNIYISNTSASNIDLNITGNELSGGTSAGLFVLNDNSSAVMNLDISSNAFMEYKDFYFPSGIFITNNQGTTTADIINNTMIDSRYGIRLIEASGSLTANIQNNIIAHASFGFSLDTSVSVSNDYNLTYDNSLNTNYTPGANTITSDPMIKSLTNPRLRDGSPAIDTGNAVATLLVADAPFFDADGTARYKKLGGIGATQVDMGAYEYGDVFFTHKNQASGSNVTILNNSNLDGDSGLDDLHVTSNYNPPGELGVYNVDNEGIYYFNGLWRVFNQGLVSIANGANFNIFKFGNTGSTFLHSVPSSGSSNTTISHSGLDGHNEYILQVSQHWTGTYNAHPFGITYFAGNWIVLNFDLVDFDTGSNFNVYYQEASKSAWEHIASSQNISGNSTILNNPLITGVDCAQIQVTQSSSQGILNNSPVGVWYSAPNWLIFNQDFTSMPVDAAFHVTISPEQIAECQDLIFKNGFD